MQIVVNDTNLFIDLIHAELIDLFFRLPFEVHTTDFVVGEIEDSEQEAIIMELIVTERLYVAEMTSGEVEEILLLQVADNRLSIPDCSVWYYSKKNSFILLTGDNLLRKTASNDQITVRGILYVFDELVRTGLISSVEASVKLQFLLDTGSRLPKDDCIDRLKEWNK